MTVTFVSMMSVCKLLCTTEGFGVSNLEIICYHPQKKSTNLSVSSFM